MKLMVSILVLMLTMGTFYVVASSFPIISNRFLISALACLVLLWFSKTTSKLTTCNDTSAVQAAHTTPTPRIGGLAIMLGLVAATLIVSLSGAASTQVVLMLSALPVFVVGLAEDLGRLASPRNRLVLR